MHFGRLKIPRLPVDPQYFARLPHAYVAWDIAVGASNGSILMAQRDDGASHPDTQPLKFGPLAMTWEGRLNNREDVAVHAGIRDIENISDPAIVLKAYASYRDSIFDKLIGEFSVVVWHKRHHVLQFARSASGAQNIYYLLTKETLIWSSDLAHLATMAGIKLIANGEHVTDKLLPELDSKQASAPFVRVAPPNHVLTFEPGRFTSRPLGNPQSPCHRQPSTNPFLRAIHFFLQR